MTKCRIVSLVAFCSLLAPACLAQGSHLAAIAPWTFDDGNKTSRENVVETVRKIAEHRGLIVLPQEHVTEIYDHLHPAVAFRRGFPVTEDLQRFGRAVGADLLLFGHVSWHTRSIWVGTGPKTISTAKVDVYAFRVKTGKIEFEKEGVEARSDEKESTLKDVADVLITPIITVVSGGPATPREERAVQIAIGRAMLPWARGKSR